MLKETSLSTSHVRLGGRVGSGEVGGRGGERKERGRRVEGKRGRVRKVEFEQKL